MDEAIEFRALVLNWLAGLLAAPIDEATVSRCRGTEAAALFDALASELGCRDAITRMRAMLTTNASPRTVALDLSVAYTRLFEGVTGSTAVHLCESAYTGTRLFDQPARDIAELLPRVGLATRGGEPPDHLCVELALLANLLCMGDADHSALLETRLARWIPRFVANCRAWDPDGFYGAIATVLGALFGVPPSFEPDAGVVEHAGRPNSTCADHSEI